MVELCKWMNCWVIVAGRERVHWGEPGLCSLLGLTGGWATFALLQTAYARYEPARRLRRSVA